MKKKFRKYGNCQKKLCCIYLYNLKDIYDWSLEIGLKIKLKLVKTLQKIIYQQVYYFIPTFLPILNIFINQNLKWTSLKNICMRLI